MPADEAQVLERLPEQTSPRLRELKALRATLARDPVNLQRATQLARRYIEASRSEGDPRYLGYAQAALAPWWHAADAPSQVLVLRATILQSNHDFVPAVADLSAVLQRESRSGQARLTRATVLTVMGRYDDARADCAGLDGVLPPIYAVVCASGIASVTGNAVGAYAMVERALAILDADTNAREWAETLAAETAFRLDDAAGAERHFRAALALDAHDPYLVGAYCDFLLDQRRAREVLPLIPADTRIDPLLLRLALAQQALGAPQAAATIATLAARVEASRARGDVVHRREEARYALALGGDPVRALALARANFLVQREPADVRVLAEAAVATRDAAALDTVRKWLADTKLEYGAVTRLLAGGAQASGK